MRGHVQFIGIHYICYVLFLITFLGCDAAQTELVQPEGSSDTESVEESSEESEISSSSSSVSEKESSAESSGEESSTSSSSNTTYNPPSCSQTESSEESSNESSSSISEKYDVDFGPQVKIFDPSMSMSDIENQINEIHTRLAAAEFSDERWAYLFQPGTYDLDVNVGYYQHAAGLGLLPGDVVINGAVQSKTTENSGNITTQFWRIAENFEIHPDGDATWAVSQAAPYRRMHVKGGLEIDMGTGYASGGFLSNSIIEGTVSAIQQQQWFTRNCDVGGWSGVNWNVVWVGVPGAQEGWTNALSETAIDVAPAVREKPVLYVDAVGNYNVFVPEVRYDASGASWKEGVPEGRHIPIKSFYIADPKDAASDINAALNEGKHLVLTPGIYKLDAPIKVVHEGTVVLGLGLPSLVPQGGDAALITADEDGVVISGVVIDGGPINSPSLMVIGESGSSGSHDGNPISLNDIFCRIGGQFSGRADVCITINSSDVLADHFWLWRADHGNGANWDVGYKGENYGWDENPSKHGLVVNGDNVIVYGLFNEHFQEYQTLWNGENGQTYFYQSEIPYDPPNQDVWKDGNSVGYPAYKVADDVTAHAAYGMGMYAFFYNPVRMANAVETPRSAGIHIEDIVTVTFSGAGGGMENVVNDEGGQTNDGELNYYPGYFGE